MRVAVLNGPGDLEVAAVGVCGSDTHYYEHGRIGRFVVESPLVLGHEASGRIVEVGAGVDPARVGRRVSIEPGVPCFTCEQCLAGRYNLCYDMRFYATPPIDGAFAQLVTVHSAFAHDIPDSVSDDAAALLEPLSVGVWAARKARVGAGTRVLVIGAGPIGMVAVQVAKACGATSIAVADINEHRLEVARELGATQTIDSRTQSLDELTERPEVLLECSGNGPATIAAIKALAPAGRVVLVGMGGDELALPLSVVQERELEVTGTFRYANTWPTAIRLAASGVVDLDRLVTGHVGLAEAADALLAGRTDPAAIKTIVCPQR
ncbi:NAD(P)-dependent alcohol dehydrogenase [Arsenicicoccus piscis]|uniref:Sorbitol dehydrogenase n=1 Tax=Arsenicicoccus piscis TaxID=673954 RepID=A0ABQ6HNX7_9MICO|nr:NAD(P)-dependent alcohol dehydrogenase [Arsenicicoccus piscis]MCH8629254.1 NAD(P)-dependent alcohol dehydrogenase [Arsenicicoccus piscis]GMA19788.1 sorbitol dehydrogenase [Arsenicicoccus piscis]